MRILVTGANGFIGRAVCRVLAEQGNEVAGLVRSSADGLQGVDLFVGSLEDEALIRQALVGVDCIVHLAGRAHLLKDDAADPLAEFRAVNRDATLRLASLAAEMGIRRFVFMSSIGVNGSRTRQDAYSESNRAAPHAPYAVSKFEAEQGLAERLEGSPCDWVVVRPPLVYAANAPGNFRRLLKLVAGGVPLPFGLVNNRRSMIALENLADFVSLVIRHPDAANQVYLVADDEPVSTREIAVSLAQGMGRSLICLPVPPLFIRLGLGLIGKRSVYTQLCESLEISTTKARALGWEPRLRVKEALVAVGRAYVSGKTK